MLENITCYIHNCAKHAWKDSIDSALNWSGIVGIAAMGSLYKYKGHNMTLPSDWIPAIYFGINTAWILIFLFRFVVVSPYHLWRESQDEIKRLTSPESPEVKVIKEQTAAIQNQTSEIIYQGLRSRIKTD